MKIILKISILFLLMTQSITAQLYKTHNWSKTPEFTEISTEDAKLPSVAIKEKYLIQYHKPSILINLVDLYETRHSIIRVNSEKGIKRHNRVYIPTRNVIDVIDIKARVLTSGGKIKVLNKNNIKELKDVEGYGGFRIFAIEGVTKNSQLEYIYTLEKKMSSMGTIIAQNDYKINECEVIIRGTIGNRIKYKSYNGFTNLTEVKVKGNKKALKGIMKNIPAMTKEPVSTATANRMKISYIASANSVFIDDYQQWENLENNIYQRFMRLNPRSYKKLTSDFTKFTSNEKLNTQSEKINAVCKYIHRNFHIIRSKNNFNDDIKKVIKEKQGSELAIVKLYSILYNYLDIPFELALTSNRFNHKFDSTFYSSLNIQKLLFYFPEEQKYTNPSSVISYLDNADSRFIGNKAIFVSKGSRKFKVIKIPKMEETVTNRKFDVNINIEDTNVEVKANHKLTGYKASNNRGAYRYFKKKDLNEFQNNTFASDIDDVEFLTIKYKNEDLSNCTENNPFIMEYNYNAESLLEEVGNNIILNIGKLIGKQTELYQEVERVNPIELRYPNQYQYEFVITIPDGYKATNLNDFKQTIKLNTFDEKVCSFISNYEVEDNIITIKFIESYNKLHILKEDYIKYKSVVNAAYDFSKKSILFEKK